MANSAVQQMNRELARKISDEALANPQSRFAGKFVGIANGQVASVAGDADEAIRQLLLVESDSAKTVCIEAGVDYSEVQERVIQALNGVRDPRTGQAPVRLACRLEDARGLGLYGPSMGDVIYAMAPGFQCRSGIQAPAGCWIGGRLRPERLPLLVGTRLFREFTGEHDTSLPVTRAIRTLLYAAGPGVRHGRRQVPVSLVDVAPTLCRWLGLPAPAQCEGSAITGLWEEDGASPAGAAGQLSGRTA